MLETGARMRRIADLKKMKRGWMSILPVCLLPLLLSTFACSSIDCPVQNTVAAIYEVNGTLDDTLTISVKRQDGSDTILLSNGVGLTTFKLPMSYHRTVDTLLFRSAKLAAVDTVWVTKDNIPHFESVDCGLSYFHNVISVRHTTIGIDSIVILKTLIDYDPMESHFRIYFKARG